MTVDAHAATQAFLSQHGRVISAPLAGTDSANLAIARVSYTHDAMIDLIINNPRISQNEIAKHFGYTAAWVSRIKNSDAFQQRLAARKADLVDPSILATLEEKFAALADRSMDIIQEKLELTQSPDLAFKALELSSKALGYGARQQNVAVQQNFVVAMPQKAESGAAWAAQHGPQTPQLQQISEATIVAEKD